MHWPDLDLGCQIKIKVHSSRFKVYNVDELKCPLCLSAVDNEVHFVLCCPAFDDLRYKFIDPKYCNNPCEFWLALLLATQNKHTFKTILPCLCIKHSEEEKNCYCEELKLNELIIKKVITTGFASALFICNIPTPANWILCALPYEVYCAYTPSNEAMALLN